MAALEHAIDGPDGAPVLVLANSVGTTKAMWEPQLPALRSRLRVLRYEHPGHGESALPPKPCGVGDLARPVLGLLDELGIAQASFCGLSLGGMVGMWLGRHAPERIERLTLCSTSAGFGAPETWEARAAAVRRDGLGAVADLVMERYFCEAFRKRSSDVVARYRETFLALPAEGYARCCEAIRDWDFRDELAGIGAPTLAIAGEEDGATPPEQLEQIAGGIPDARLERVPAAGHLVNVEQPAAFTTILASHLRLRE